MVAKEEGGSSQLVQPCGADVAMEDKSQARDLMGMIRNATSITRGVISQWDLLHVGLALLRRGGSAWETSFKKTNLHPNHRLCFEDWIKKIAPKLQGSLEFKSEYVVDKFNLLPSFWHGMLPTERERVISIIDSHEGSYTVRCLQQLHIECKLPYSNMQMVQVCHAVSKELPDSIVRESPGLVDLAIGAPPVEAAAADLVNVNSGLLNFQRCPPGMHGRGLLDHMMDFIKRRTKKGEKVMPSSDSRLKHASDVETSADRHTLINPTYEDFVIREILRGAGGDGVSKRLAQRKLDSTSFVNACCCEETNPKRLARLKAALEITASMAEVSKPQQEDKEKKNEEELTGLTPIATTSLLKLKSKDWVIDKTHHLMRSISVVSNPKIE